MKKIKGFNKTVIKFKKYLAGLDMSNPEKVNKVVDDCMKGIAVNSITESIQQTEDIYVELNKIFMRYKKVVALGSRLKKTRELKNISAAKLGEMSNLSPSLISKIENGKSYLPKVESLVSMAKVLEISPNVFLDIIKNYDDKYLVPEEKVNWENQIAKILYELGIKGENLNHVIRFIKYTEWSIKDGRKTNRKI